MRPLKDLLVVDLSRYLPGPFASRELLELGARVVRLLPPTGDPMQDLAPAWHAALNDGKETVKVNLKEDPEPGLALLRDADVVLESFRPGVVDRLGGEPIPRLLTGGLACYRIYETADHRHLTVAALEREFFTRLCELLDLAPLVERQFDPAAQEDLADALAERIASKPLATWLELFDGEDVSVGPVATLEEAAAELA